MEALAVFAIIIVGYFIVGWALVWIYYSISYFLVHITNNSQYAVNHKCKERIVLIWPIIAVFALFFVVFYIPYMTLLKFTPRSPT